MSKTKGYLKLFIYTVITIYILSVIGSFLSPGIGFVTPEEKANNQKESEQMQKDIDAKYDYKNKNTQNKGVKNENNIDNNLEPEDQEDGYSEDNEDLEPP